MTGVRASSKRTKDRSEKRPANPGVWWGWQDEPGLGHRSDVEFCTWSTAAPSRMVPAGRQCRRRRPGVRLATESAGDAERAAPAAQPHSTAGEVLQQHPGEDAEDGLDHNPGTSADCKTTRKVTYASKSTWREVSSDMSHTFYLLSFSWIKDI